VTLLRGVLEVLEDQEVRYALIGATALAIHGVSRSTADVGLLVDDERVLDPGLWTSLRDGGASTRIVRGDPDDPLLGAVRISTPQERTIDIVVIPGGWVRDILEGTTAFAFAGTDVAVASASGLILLKLYAGGAKEAWDIRALLESRDDPNSLRADVDARIESMPAECRRLWAQLRKPE